MAFLHGKSTAVYFAEKNLTAYFNSASRNASVETAETTVFGQNSKSYIAGLKDGTVSVAGLFDGAAGAVDEILAGSLGATSAKPVTFVLAATPAVGSPTQHGGGVTTSYEVSAPVGDVVSTSAEFQMTQGSHSGVLLLPPSTAITATGNQSSVDFGTAPTPPTTGGWVACLHVISNTMNNNTVFTLQDSANNSTFASLGSFTTVPAATTTSQHYYLVPDSVERYVRLAYTCSGTGSISGAVSFARIL